MVDFISPAVLELPVRWSEVDTAEERLLCE